MAGVLSMDEDWDLQAIVRGCSDDHLTSIQNYHDDLLFNIPDLYEVSSNNSSVLLDDLDDIYKPFYPIFHSPSTQVEPSHSFSGEANLCQETMDKVLEQEIVDNKSGTNVVGSTKTVTDTTKYKRRKSQNKRILVEATAEGLPLDLWAWRKYGQKPIKGSPYPRSYYRCSSSKGCLARKQVEQSCTDQGMFIVTYSGEHSHTQPTRRGSLAGMNRHKFSVPKKTSLPGNTSTTETIKEELSCSSPFDIAMFSPSTPLIPSIEEVQTKKENFDMMLNDEFFAGLDELNGLI